MCPTPKPGRKIYYSSIPKIQIFNFLKHDLKQEFTAPLSHDKERSWLRRKDLPDRYGPIT
jgi:hypothetical protein